MRDKKEYSTIKGLVFHIIRQTNGKVDYETVTKCVRKHFPKSKWKPSHWSWYRTQISKGRFTEEFSHEVMKNLGLKKYGRIPVSVEPAQEIEENRIKRLGDSILNHVRIMVKELAGDDEDFELKLNRWVFARLQQDEIRKKRPIKQELWDLGMQCCQECGKKFETIKGVEIHRKDTERAYSIDNCELLCRACHQKKR